jgi:phage tail sheath protein FI
MTGGLIGDPVAKSGMYALMDVDLFNILCIPATMKLPDINAAQVTTEATSLCTTRRAMYLLDVPQHDAVRDTVDAITTWLDANAGLRSRNAALYFPRMDIADSLANYRLRKVSTSGTVAGLWARIDASRGVWKAPAGTEASLAGVQQLEYKLTDPERRTESACHQLPSRVPGLWTGLLGRAHAVRRGSACRRLQIHPDPASCVVHRGKLVSRHPMGGVRAER